jgi:hypothetical protein
MDLSGREGANKALFVPGGPNIHLLVVPPLQRRP